MKLTQKQHQVLTYIQEFTHQHGYAPSYEEIAQGIGTRSRGSVFKHIRSLIELGYLEKNPEKNRSLQVLQPLQLAPRRPHHTGIPFVGRIAAGKPILAFEEPEPLDIQEYLTHQASCFILEVVGDSMMGCGIIEGDLVVIQPQNTARNGQIVVALIDGIEATLKRFRRHNAHSISLIPENIHMQPMIYPEERVTIQGVLIAQIRKY